jgi:hypothetical protein
MGAGKRTGRACVAIFVPNSGVLLHCNVGALGMRGDVTL